MTAQTKGRHVAPKTRSTPGSHLPDGPRSIVAHLVASVDPTHFSPVDFPLLEQYATAAHQASVAAEHLASTGAVVDGKASPWLTVQEKSVRALVALSARLRICPQSRFDRLVAGANARPQPERVDDDDEDDGLLAR